MHAHRKLAIAAWAITLALLPGCRRAAAPDAPAPAAETRGSLTETQDSDVVADEVRNLLLEERVELARARLEQAFAEGARGARVHWIAAVAALMDNDAAAFEQHQRALDDAPRWAALLRARARQGRVPRREAVSSARAAREALDDHPDAVWVEALALAPLYDDERLLQLAALPTLSETVEDFVYRRAIRSQAFRVTSSSPPSRPPEQALLDLIAQAEREVPSSVLARQEAAVALLRLGRHGDARRVAERGLEARPGDPTLAVLRARAAIAEAAEQDAARERLRAELTRLTSQYEGDPASLGTLADGLDDIGATEAAASVRDDVRRRFPRSRAVERWDWNAVSPWRVVVPCRMSQGKGTVLPSEELARMRQPLQALYAHRRARDLSLWTATHAALIELFECDAKPPVDELEVTARGLLSGFGYPKYEAEAAVLLATHGGDLELAERLARRSLALHRDWTAGLEVVLTLSDLEQEQRASEAYAHDAVGFVHLRAGRRAEARRHLERALELFPTASYIALHAAEIAELDGEPARAEAILARAIAANGPAATDCRERLRVLVEHRGGSEREVDRTVQRLERARRQRVAVEAVASRNDPAPAVEPFDLKLRGGDRIHSDALRGKVTLIVVTTPWCTGCRLEAPKLAKIQERYRGREDVEFLVITKDPEGVAKLHESEGFDTPIAQAGEWEQRAGINGYPTHLLLDRDGNVAFRAFGGRDIDITVPARIDALLGEAKR